jgi:hypothetical protein
MEEINKKLKEWSSICRISNIKEDPLTYSYSDMLSFAKYYHESQAKNNESLHLVSCSKCGEPMKRSVAQWTCINQLCSGETKYDNVPYMICGMKWS